VSSFLSDSPIDPAAVQRAVVSPSHGAVVTFLGTVRDHHAGRSVTGLEYSCYAEMAEQECRRIVDEAAEKFSARVDVRHRIGKLKVGDVAVVVASAAAHRDAAFESCRWVIDAVKARVPIWKHEHFADGTSAWVDPTTVGEPWA
jgi:molybdopterin synthase catalytic subunit